MLPLFFLASTLLSSSNAQCGDALDDATALAHANSIAALFPKPLTTAKIVSGDEEAQKIFDAITSNPTYTAALAISPKSENITYDASDPDCWWSRGGCVTPKQSYLSPDHHNCEQQGTWGLTFDDGPTCASAQLYSRLQTEKLKASLYFIGGNVLQFPGQAQAAVEAGHEICGHTWSHQETTYLSNEEVFAEMYYTTKAIKAITGVQSKCFRPSYGDVDDRVRAIGHALGLRIDLWSDDTFDWQIGESGKKVIDRNYAAIFAKANQSTGVTVLTHESSLLTVRQFENRLPKAKAAFKVFAPIGICTDAKYFYTQQNITFPTYAEYISGTIEPSTPWQSFMSTGELDLPLLEAVASVSSVSASETSTSQKASSTGSAATVSGTTQNSSVSNETSSAISTKGWSLGSLTILVGTALYYLI